MALANAILPTVVSEISPASRFEAVTPSDTVDLSPSVKAIYCITDGTVNLMDWTNPTPNQLAIPMVAGQQVNVRARRIMATGTSGWAGAILYD